MSKQIVIFDFDGVIADTFEVCYEINRISDPELSMNEYRARFEGNIYHVKPERVPHRQINFFAEFDKRILDAPLVSGIDKVIQHLGNNYDTVIVSSTISALIDKYLSYHRTIAVTWGYQQRPTIAAGTPTAIVDTPQSIVEAVSSILGNDQRSG